MPCTHDQDYGETPFQRRARLDIERREREERQLLTRLACDRCREIEARGGAVPEWAQEWWELHKKIDATLAKLPRKQQESAIRAAALAKLTAEEREELGL